MRLTGSGLLHPPRRKRAAATTPGVSRKCLRSTHDEEVIAAADTGAEGVSTVRQAGPRGCGSDESCRSVTQVLLTPAKGWLHASDRLTGPRQECSALSAGDASTPPHQTLLSRLTELKFHIEGH